MAGALLLLGWLNYAPYWNPDEGRYASSSLEMVGGIQGAQADWVVPHLNTIPRLNKPPLVYWVAGSFYKIFGVSEWAGRLGPALAAVLVLWLVYQMGRRMFDEQTGILGALVWSSSVLPVSLGRTLNTDMLLSAAMAVVLYGLWLAVQEQEKSSWRPYLISGIGMGFAMLAKGPVGVALPLIIAALFFWRTKFWNRVRWPKMIGAFLIMAAIAAPWFIAIEQRQPGFTYKFIIVENLDRFSGAVEHHKPSPLWYYFPVALFGLLPWTPLTFSALTRSRDTDAGRRSSRLFLWLWAAIIILFFSKSSTKLVSYILPAYPALALLAADGILRASKATRRWTSVVIAVLYSAAAVAIAIQLSSDNTLPRSVALPYTVSFLMVLVGGAVIVVRLWNAGQLWKAAVAQFCTAALLFVCLLSFAGRIAYYEESSDMYIALRPYLQPTDTVAQVSSFSPTGIFYLRRPVMQPNFGNTSGLDDTTIEKSPLFPEHQSSDLSWFFNRAERVFLSIRWRRAGYALLSVKELKDVGGLIAKLRNADDSLSRFLSEQFSPDLQKQLAAYNNGTVPSKQLQQALVAELNRLLKGRSFYNEAKSAQVKFKESTKWLLGQKQEGADLIRLNRSILEDAYPEHIDETPKDYVVPAGTYTWARNNDFKIISNRPAPPDFHHDYTAPKKAILDTDPLAGPPPQS